eukprot:3355568-Pleurochrysis_carterae.AAC.1
MESRVYAGSSLMPQKKNPDAAELLRGNETARSALQAERRTSTRALSHAYTWPVRAHAPGQAQ